MAQEEWTGVFSGSGGVDRSIQWFKRSRPEVLEQAGGSKIPLPADAFFHSSLGKDMDALTASALPGGRFGTAFSKGLKGFGRRLNSAAAGGLYSAKRQVINKAKTLPISAGRGLRRAAIGGVTGGTAGLLALGAGAATGDPAKAAALAMAAGSAGYNFGNYYGDGLAKGIVTSAKAANTGFWGDDLKALNQYKFDKEFMKSPETMSSLTQALGSTSEAKKAIDNGWVQALLNNNITDPSKLAKATKLARDYMDKKKMSEPDALNRAIAMAKMNRDVNPGIFNPMSRENTIFRENMMKRLKAQYGNNISESEASKQIDALIDELAYFDM